MTCLTCKKKINEKEDARWLLDDNTKAVHISCLKHSIKNPLNYRKETLALAIDYIYYKQNQRKKLSIYRDKMLTILDEEIDFLLLFCKGELK